MGRLVSETADTFSASYTYDAFGNRATKQQIKDGITSNTAYTYDLNNRLTYLAENNGTTTNEVTYTYDNAGNMLTRIRGVYAPDTNAEQSISLTTGTSPYVDTFAYNALGQLMSADIGGNVSAYTYDVDGIRNSITESGITTNLVNISGSVVGEITPNGTTTYYRAGSQIMYSNNGTANSVYTYNGHGDVIKVGTDAYTYDAFGNALAESTNGQPFRYCGEYYDQETGMIYLRNRYYDPSVGRFISEDTHWNPDNMVYGNTTNYMVSISAIRQSGNLYVYCVNNPTIFVDSSGNIIEILDHSGSRLGNFYGHTDIAIDGLVYSFAAYDAESTESFGSYGNGVIMVVDNYTYIQNRIQEGRTVTVYELNTTPEEEKIIKEYYLELIKDGEKMNMESSMGAEYYKTNKKYSVIGLGGENCVGVVADALNEAEFYPLFWYESPRTPTEMKTVLDQSYYGIFGGFYKSDMVKSVSIYSSQKE